ncbi:efflux RND transporter periplasmic adaptor subunit [Magnetococcales bacterium HHB-1]
MIKKLILYIALPGALAAWFLWPGRSPASDPTPPPAPKTAAAPKTTTPEPQTNYGDIITVESGTNSPTTTLGGTVIPYKEVSLSAQMPGRIEELAGREGDGFKKGTLLVQLTNHNLMAKRQSAYAQLAKAQAGWRNARVQYTRQVISGSDFATNTGMGMPKIMDEVLTSPIAEMMGAYSPELSRRAQIYAHGIGIDQAHFSLLQAQAAIKEVESSLRDTKTIAPFDGVIIRKHVEKGDTVQPGMPLLHFADTKRLQIKVDVPARLMPGLHKDMVILAKVDVADKTIETRVAQIYPTADPSRHTVTVKLDLPADVPGGPGMYAEVQVPDNTTAIKNLPVIPQSAVVKRGSLPGVFVAEGSPPKPALRAIRLGNAVGTDQTTVLSGLKADQKIYAAPPQTVAPRWFTANNH